ncbi:MAG: 50S ribosomal protein L13 [Planctomycetota bacterium]|nr:MAG: 50S ribosomal protein L13 [Planctomycetota bacterium]
MKTYMAKPSEIERRWWLVDAEGEVLGRLAARIARILMGKHRPSYTPHLDTGDYVVVVNVSKIKVTGNKREKKTYDRYSGYPGGRTVETLGSLLARKPEEVLRLAVRRMLPKNRLGRRMLKKLRLHETLPEHGYKAQGLEPLPAPTPLFGAKVQSA